MPRTATRLMIATQVKKMHAKRVTAIRLLAEEDESAARYTRQRKTGKRRPTCRAEGTKRKEEKEKT